LIQEKASEEKRIENERKKVMFDALKEQMETDLKVSTVYFNRIF
jgi:hypothetical protein